MVDASESGQDRPPAPPGDAPGEVPEKDLGLDQFESVVDAPGISLDELSQAYAQLIGKGSDPYEPPSQTPATEAEKVVDQTESPEEATAGELCPKSIIEAILFVGHPRNEPMSSTQLAGLMRGVPPREVDELIAELNAEYQERRHPFQVAMHGAGYRLELRSEFDSMRNVFYGRVREARLSQSVIDVLAIVAYQQGCTRQEVESIRGRPSGPILSQLVRRRLLRIERPSEKPRTPRYFVADRFLELFGLSSIDELPQSHDID
jgi:segregation and condensation protein B